MVVILIDERFSITRTDIYTGGTGSSTQSTGSGRSGFGTLSPSFFPIKPPEKLVQQFRDGPHPPGGVTSSKGRHGRERLATPPPPGSPRKHRNTSSSGESLADMRMVYWCMGCGCIYIFVCRLTLIQLLQIYTMVCSSTRWCACQSDSRYLLLLNGD